jgi:hypothetical protein
MVSLTAISMVFLLVNVVDSMADKPDDVVEKAVEKAKEVVDKATGNNGNDKSKGNDNDKDEDDNKKSDSKDNDNDSKDENSSKQGDEVQSQAKDDDSTPHKKKHKITNNLNVRGSGVIYDLKKPVIQQILHTQNTTCVQVSDDTGIEAVTSGSVSLELHAGSYNWYCAKGLFNHIIVEDLAGNKVNQAQNNVQVDQQSSAKSQPQPLNFRFKNMNSLFVKKVTPPDFSVPDTIADLIVNDKQADEPVNTELFGIRFKNMNSMLFRQLTDIVPATDTAVVDTHVDELVKAKLFRIGFNDTISLLFRQPL